MKVLILILLQDAKKCGGKVINFTVQRLCKESPVKHSEWRLTALIKSQNWPAGVVFSEMKNVFFLTSLTKKPNNSVHIILELTDVAGYF